MEKYLVQVKAVSVRKYKIPKSAIILAIFSLSFPTIGNSSESESSSTYPHIPEPMVYDLVRPLGALQGELEANTLLQYDFEHDRVEPSPEVEYAFLDGYAIEFELDTLIPVRSGTFNPVITGYKPSLQGTFSYPTSHHFVHGWQYSGEYYVGGIDGKRYSNTALYLFGYRFNEHWSTLNMAGMRHTEFDSKSHFEGLLNSTLFYSLSSKLVMGLEVNWEYKPTLPDRTLIMPQVHLRLTEHVNLQLGVGMKRAVNRNFAHSAMRFIFTF
jgi:hypothetical protein